MTNKFYRIIHRKKGEKMKENKKMELLEDMLGMDSGTLKAEMVLADLNEWDSMAALALIVLIDDEFGKTIDSTVIEKLITVQDILNIMCE